MRLNRRRLLLATGVSVTLPVAWSQSVRTHRVLWLSVVPEKDGSSWLAPFIEEMEKLGYVQGKNLILDARWGDNSRDRLDQLALEAAKLKPAVIVTQGPALHAARKIPGTTPVVFGFSGDPVELGVAKSLARPGGYFTGVTFLSYELSGKRVELLLEALPKLKRLAVLSNPHHVGDNKELASTREAAIRFGLTITHHPAGNPKALEQALVDILAARAEAMLIHPDGLMVQQRKVIADFALKHRIPAISGWASMAEGGSLMTYGPNQQESYRRLAYYTDRVLRGTSPQDLPVELPTRIELVVNMKTAKALDLKIPATIMVRANRIIE